MSLPAMDAVRLDHVAERRDPLVRLHQVSVVHGRGHGAVRALDDVTGQVAPGARLAIVGQSGSGKSTLVHVMAGLQRISSGSVDWPSLGAAHLPELSEQVGVVFQSPSLLPPLDAVENVALPLLLRGVPQDDATALALAALELVGLAAVANQLPEELSGGQAQRVAVARALVTRPALVLADEPTGQLDHETAAHLLDLMIEQADAVGAALVVSTHDTAVADRFDTRWRMSDGHLILEQTP